MLQGGLEGRGRTPPLLCLEQGEGPTPVSSGSWPGTYVLSWRGKGVIGGWLATVRRKMWPECRPLEVASLPAGCPGPWVSCHELDLDMAGGPLGHVHRRALTGSWADTNPSDRRSSQPMRCLHKGVGPREGAWSRSGANRARPLPIQLVLDSVVRCRGSAPGLSPGL